MLTSSLATAEISGIFSVMAVAVCSYKMVFLAQVSCGSLMSEVFKSNSPSELVSAVETLLLCLLASDVASWQRSVKTDGALGRQSVED